MDRTRRPPQPDRRTRRPHQALQGRHQSRLRRLNRRPRVTNLFRFLQFEYAWPLGPHDGRYIARHHAGEDAHQILVFNSWETKPQRSSKRWGRESEPEAVPAETALSRATIVDSIKIDEPEAKRWLAALDEDAANLAIEEGLKVLNNAIRVHRAAAADVTVREVSPENALTLRAGYGIGDEVAEGNWTSARDLSWSGKRRSRRQKRMDALRPQERLAAVLGGRDAVLACEEMALRARLDVEAGRYREAALQTHLAVEAAVAEFKAFTEIETVTRRRDDLEATRSIASAAANEALEGGLSSDSVEQVQEALRQVEALLRARAASAAY